MWGFFSLPIRRNIQEHPSYADVLLETQKQQKIALLLFCDSETLKGLMEQALVITLDSKNSWDSRRSPQYLWEEGSVCNQESVINIGRQMLLVFVTGLQPLQKFLNDSNSCQPCQKLYALSILKDQSYNKKILPSGNLTGLNLIMG